MAAPNGTLRVVLLSAQNLPGPADLSCSVNVGHGENGGSTHCIRNGGPNPVFNSTFSLPFEDRAPVDFEVIDQMTGKVIAEGARHTTDVTETDPWSGEISLSPSGILRVSIEFMKAPTNPPTKATIVVGKGKNFHDQAFRAGAVRVLLTAAATGQTDLVERNTEGTFVWDCVLDFDYANEQQLLLEVLDRTGHVVASAQFDLWTLEAHENRSTTGDLPVADASNQIYGKVGIHIALWDPATVTDSPFARALKAAEQYRPPSEEEEEPVPSSIPEPVDPPPPLPTRATFDDSPNPVGAEASAAADAAKDAAAVAQEAARIRPTLKPQKSAARAVLAAEAADDAARCVDGAHLAKQQQALAESAARDAILDAARELHTACEKAAARANAAAVAASDIAAECPLAVPEQEAAEAAAQKAQERLRISREALDALGPNPDLKRAATLLQAIADAAKAATRYRDIAEEAARRAARLARREKRCEEKTHEKLERRARELELENEQYRQMEEAREAAFRRNRPPLDLHEQTILKTAAAHSYHGGLVTTPQARRQGGIRTLAEQDYDLLPAACCYVPGTARAFRDPPQFPAPPETYMIASPRSPVSASDDLLSPRSLDRYRYDVIAYGVPAPELDILIEGEQKAPMCCMCCGIRWNTCC